MMFSSPSILMFPSLPFTSITSNEPPTLTSSYSAVVLVSVTIFPFPFTFSPFPQFCEFIEKETIKSTIDIFIF